jgi:hypothetical protein
VMRGGGYFGTKANPSVRNLQKKTNLYATEVKSYKLKVESKSSSLLTYTFRLLTSISFF